MTKPVSQMTTYQKLDAARGYIASAEKSLVDGKKDGAKQTLSRVISYVQHAIKDLA